MASVKDFESGMSVGHFRLQKLLGEGGMGAVYMAEDLTLARRVALKFMSRALLSNMTDEELRGKIEQRFIREAKSAASINHPYIAQIYEANFDSDVWYIAQELVDGSTLDAVFKEQGLFRWEEALRVLRQCCEALDYAWDAHRIIHRDIKPQNIMLTRRGGNVKIIDLGLAKPVHEKTEEELEVTAAGVPVGTPYYMAPEQATGGQVDFRADIFALGASLYEILTGKKAYPGRTPPMIYSMMMSRKYIRLAEAVPGIPAGVSEILDKMLSPEAQDRGRDYGEIIAMIDALLGRSAGAAASATQVTSMGTFLSGATLFDELATTQASVLPVDHKIAERYRILKMIGRGNTGVVYHCLDVQLGRECSVKVVVSGREYPEAVFARVKANYKELFQHRHANLVEMYDLQESANGQEIYVVMELLRGTNLLMKANAAYLQEAEAAARPAYWGATLGAVAVALDEVARALGRVHGDLKPASIFLTEAGQVKLLDYGIMNLSSAQDPQRGQPELWRYPIAHPDYMSPELWRHEDPTASSDQYSLAVICQELFTRKLPFWTYEGLDVGMTLSADTLPELLRKQYERVQQELAPPCPGLSSSELKALARALAKDPAGRHASAVDFIGALCGYRAAAAATRQSADTSFVSHRTLILAGLILAAGAGYYIHQQSKGKALALLRDDLAQVKAQMQTQEGQLLANDAIRAEIDSCQAALQRADINAARATQVAALIDARRTELRRQLAASVSTLSKSLAERLPQLQALQRLPLLPAPERARVEALLAQAQAALAVESASLIQLVTAESMLKSALSDESALQVQAPQWRQATLLQIRERELPALRQMELIYAEAGSEGAAAAKLLQSALAQIAAADVDAALASLESLHKLAADLEPRLAAVLRPRLERVTLENAAAISELESLQWLDQALERQINGLVLRVPPADAGLVEQYALERAKAAECQELLGPARLSLEQQRVNLRRDLAAAGADLSQLRLLGDLVPQTADYEALQKKFVAALDAGELKGLAVQVQRLGQEAAAALAKGRAQCVSESTTLHGTLAAIMQALGPYADVNPEVTRRLSQLSVEESLARDEIGQSKHLAALGRLRPAAAEAKNLQALVARLVKAEPGQDFAVPRLGLSLVWLKEMNLWAGRHEVSCAEYRAFKPEYRAKTYNLGTLNGDRQPVNEVSALDADAYCQWLTRRALEKNEIPAGWAFRLPTAEEWSTLAAAGAPAQYVWGDAWPAPKGVNIANPEVMQQGEFLEWSDYQDDFILTAAVDKVWVNAWGLAGCAGNVWEWTASAEGGARQVMGGSWKTAAKAELLLHPSGNAAPAQAKMDNVGFRVLLAPAR